MVQIVPPKLKEIMKAPTEIDGINQSRFRNTGILLYILEMVRRGDNKETIWDVYRLLSDADEDKDDQGRIMCYDCDGNALGTLGALTTEEVTHNDREES